MQHYQQSPRSAPIKLDRDSLSQDECALWRGKFDFYRNQLHLHDDEAAREADRIIEIDRETEADPHLKRE